MYNDSDLANLDRRRALKSMAAVGAAGLFAGCSGGEDPPEHIEDDDDGGGGDGGGTFRIATGEDVETFDPRLNTLAWYSAAAHYVFDSLLLLEPDGSGTVPHLAADDLEEVDETTYVAEIRDDVQFHDGSQLTAEDVAYSYNWVLDPDNASPNAANLEFIDEAEVTGEYEVTLHLAYPYALMETELAGMNAAIVPKDAAEEMGEEEFGEEPIGSGPFSFVDYEPSSTVELERFDDYFLGSAGLAGLGYEVIPETEVGYVELATGNVHQASVSETLIPEAEDDSGIDLYQFTSFDYRGLILNCLEEPFGDVRAREAMHYLVDYDDLLSGSVDTLGSRNWGYMPQEVVDAWEFPYEEWEAEYYPEQDHDRAVELLDEAGVGTDFEVEIVSLADEHWVGLSVVFQNELEQIGVDASVREVAVGEWLDALDYGEFDATIYGWGGGNDPDGYYYYMFRDLENDEGGMDDDVAGNASAGNVHQAYRGTDVEDDLQRFDGLVRDARETIDRDERYDYYVEAADIMQSLYPVISVYSSETAMGVSTDVDGYEPTEFGAQELFNHWQEASLDG